MQLVKTIEYRTVEQGTAESWSDHFDIRHSLFDILRFYRVSLKPNTHTAPCVKCVPRSPSRGMVLWYIRMKS